MCAHLVPRCAVLLAALICCACGGAVRDAAAPHTRSAQLIGAEACAPDAAPATVAVVGHATRSDGTPRTFVYCTGTLIAPDAVLVAAHCITETSAEAIFVNPTADLLFLLSADEATAATLEEESIPVRSAVPHPAYDGGSHAHDVGLLLLERPLDVLTPAVVAEEADAAQVVSGLPVRMVGYGYDEDQLAGLKRCGGSALDAVEALHLFTTGDVQGCSGDSGGGLHADVDTPHARAERVVGVASFVSDNGCVDFTAYASVLADRAFLQSTLEDCTERAWCDVPGLVPASFYDPPPPPDAGVEDVDDADVDAPAGAPSCAQGAGPAAAVLGCLLGARARRRRVFGCAPTSHLAPQNRSAAHASPARA